MGFFDLPVGLRNASVLLLACALTAACSDSGEGGIAGDGGTTGPDVTVQQDVGGDGAATYDATTDGDTAENDLQYQRQRGRGGRR